ncbi:VWA domain-containing protein [Schlesneria sp. DSM 10557]|uniref:VWA domain-containing protein n=1 Tax=Schlesneria sp. DSM 10557 TaxID=3044399 RepID=UPI0035A06BB7
MIDSFSFEVPHPWWLASLILIVPLLAYYYWRSLSDFPLRQRVISLATRTAITILLAFALAGLALLRPTQQQFVIFAIDQSLSVDSANDEQLPADGSKPPAKPSQVDEYLDRVFSQSTNPGDHKVMYLPFAAQAGTLTTERPKPSTQQPSTSPAPGSSAPALPPALDRNSTDIAAAIRSAAGAMPPDYVPRIVLLTDGNQTAGDVLQAALGTASLVTTDRKTMSGNNTPGSARDVQLIPIDTVPLKVRDENEVQVAAVDVPAQVREGEPFYVEVVINSNHEDEGLVEVFRGAHKVLSETRKLKAGENRFRFQQSITGERLAQYTVKVGGLSQDTLLDNNTESGLVFTTGKPRVLLIESETKLAQQLVWALQQEEIECDVRPVEGMPESLADLQNYELLVLSNIPATSLSQRQMELARTYVQDLGGGFMMLGGDQSFGLGGYYKTVLEEILPVRSDFEKEKEKPSLGMVLVIDKSGSMGGEKIEMAKEAAKSAAELLGPRDQLGVIAFDGDFYWVSDLQSAGNKGRIFDDISRIEAGGGTTMYPAMEEAYNSLQAATAKLKHVIVLTDGISSPGDFEGIAQSMASSRITCSTVAVGEGCDSKLLEEIARIGQGRYFEAMEASTLPQIFAKETMTASKSAINEQPFVPQLLRPTPVLADIDFETAPFLLGYVVTRPKATCEFILATESGDPLLAWWRYGLGTTVAFTSDAKSRWGAEWLTWPGFSKFWAQVVRQSMRKNDVKGVVVDVKQERRRATVSLDAIDPSGRFLNRAETEVTVIDPQLGQHKLEMKQTSPGRYVAEFDTPLSGAYHLNMTQKTSGGTLLHQQTRGLIVGYPDELRLHPTNEDLLKTLASTSGGRFSPAPDEIFPTDTGDRQSEGQPVVRPRTVQRTTPLWPPLVTIASLLFLLDVALRRIDFSLWWPWRGRFR